MVVRVKIANLDPVPTHILQSVVDVSSLVFFQSFPNEKTGSNSMTFNCQKGDEFSERFEAAV